VQVKAKCLDTAGDGYDTLVFCCKKSVVKILVHIPQNQQ
jgi:hypothetical protein